MAQPTVDAAPWREPVRGGCPDPSLTALAGLDLLRTLLEGRAPAPPISRLTGMRRTEVGLAGATFAMPATRWLLSPHGVISVGTLAMLADGPLGCAVQGALPAGIGYATSELSLRVLRPARAGGTLIARGPLVHAGRSLALSGVQIVDGGGRLLADGSSLCFVRPLPGVPAAAAPAAAAPPPPAETPDPFERPALGDVLEQDVWERMSGLEVLRALIAGELPQPPIHHLTGRCPVAAEEGGGHVHDAGRGVAVQPAGNRRGGRDRDGRRQRPRLRHPDDGAARRGGRHRLGDGAARQAGVTRRRRMMALRDR